MTLFLPVLLAGSALTSYGGSNLRKDPGGPRRTPQVSPMRIPNRDKITNRGLKPLKRRRWMRHVCGWDPLGSFDESEAVFDPLHCAIDLPVIEKPAGGLKSLCLLEPPRGGLR